MQTTTLYNNKYSKEGLLKLANLLENDRNTLDFLKTHSTVLGCFANITEAREFIQSVTENVLKGTQYSPGDSCTPQHDQAMNLLINYLKPILSRPCKFEELTEFLTSLRSPNGYAQEASRIYFARALKTSLTNASELAKVIPLLNGNNERVNLIKTIIHLITNANELIFIVSLVEVQNRLDIINEKKSLITNASELAKVLPLLNGNDERVNFIKSMLQLITNANELTSIISLVEAQSRLDIINEKMSLITNATELANVIPLLNGKDEKVNFIKTMHNLITNVDDLATVVAKLPSPDRLEIINFKTAHWELECRPKCRLAFLGGSVRPEASHHSFFQQNTIDGPSGVQDLKLMILDYAGLGPYHSPDGTIKETNHTLK